jgi:UDP-glucose 4-epimerase
VAEKNKSIKRVLVTGGAGFIGSELVHQLVNCGSEVTVVDNLVNGLRKNLDDISSKNIKLHVVDIRDEKRMAELMIGVDIVYHLACLGVRHSIHSPYENHIVNADATLKLLELARVAEVSRFVHVSTSEVYGSFQYVPMSEEHPTLPKTVYGASKLASECYARAYFETYKFPTVVVRPFNAFGPRCHHEGDSGEVIPKFMLRALAGQPMVIFGDGSQTRDFTYVRDTAHGIHLAGVTNNLAGETINLGSGKEITINELANCVIKVTEHPDSAIAHEISRPGDVLRLCADSSKAKNLLGFEPEISLENGLRLLLEWYQSLGRPPKELLREEILHNWK